MNIDEEFARFIEFPEGSSGLYVTTVSAKLFADHCIEQLKQERDQLKSEVESLRHYKDNHIDLVNHMAEHDAELIDKLRLKWINQNYDVPVEEVLRHMKDYSEQLRQKAQEVE